MFQRFALALFSAAFLVLPVQAEVLLEATPEGIVPEIESQTSIGVNRSIIFNASGTSTAFESPLTYEWQFGDGNRQEGLEVVHSYAEPGEYTVALTVRDFAGHSATAEQMVYVFKKSFVLVTNVEDEEEKIQSLIEVAREQGVYIEVLQTYTSRSGFLEEEELRRQLLEHISDLEPAEDIVIYTYGSSGLTVLSQLQQSLSNETFFEGKNIYFASEHNLGTLRNIAKGVYSSIHPQQIILTRSEALWVLVESPDTESFIQVLEERGIEYLAVDDRLKLRPWNLLSSLVNGMISRGVPSSTVLLVLMLPIIATVVAFMKQVVGLNTLGVYTPSILSLSFIALNFWYGLLIFVILFAVATLVRHALHHYRLLYIPRMAIILTFSSFAILLVLFLGTLFDQRIDELAIFPILIMATMVEKFVTIQGDKGIKGAMHIGVEVLVVAMICYFVAQWNLLEVLVLGHPEVVLIFLGFNFILARWTGLRITEYIRFREIIRHIEE
ncbi:MAG: 7TM domain-containing protein [Patescibacteria group bacterium]